MNGLGFALVVLTAVEPSLCYFPPPEEIEIDVYSHLPLMREQQGFSSMDQAKMQIQRCDEWIIRCKIMRGYSYDDGHWDRQIAMLQWTKHYWCLVYQAQDGFLVNELGTRLRLQLLKEFLGEKRFKERYEPKWLIAPQVTPMEKEQ